jgi:peptidyl-prolyl cis-trans isomerase SurA
MVRKIIFSFCVIILGCAAFANSAILLDRVMAIVNKEVITWSELYKAMEFEATEAVRAMKDEERRQLFKNSEPIFLEKLIDMRLQLQEARKLGIQATDDEVNKAIDSIRKKYGMTDEVFQQAIKKEGFSLPEYKTKLFEQITIDRLIEQEIRSKVVVTEGEIDKYFSENKEAVKEHEGFDISHIFIRHTGDKKQVEDKASEIYKRITAGENFEEIAKKESEDASARGGGHLGFVKKSDLSANFLNVLLKMKNNDVSQPFWSANGIHIIRLNEIKLFRDSRELREKVRQQLLDDKLKKYYKDWSKSLREKAYIEIKL